MLQLKDVKLKDVLNKFEFGFYEGPEVKHILEGDWKELTEEDKVEWGEYFDDRDGDKIEVGQYRVWRLEGDVEFFVVMFGSGLIQIGDEAMGECEEGSWIEVLEG